MSLSLGLIFTALGLTLFKVLHIAYRDVIRPRYVLWSQGLPSVPASRDILFGHMTEIMKEDPSVLHLRWHSRFGSTYSYTSIMQLPHIATFDKTAISFIASDSSTFQKPALTRRMLNRLLGEGLVSAEGSTHARQRKIMNPSFGPAQIKAMYPIFLEKATQLRDVILEKVNDSPKQLDMHQYAGRATLDVIGAAGFGYETHAIEGGEENELVNAFETMFRAGSQLSLVRALAEVVPALQFIAARSKETLAIKHSMATMQRIGTKLLEEKKGDGSEGKDLLSLLLKANSDKNLKNSARMSDEEVMAQISTFLLAGNDTTGSAMSWALYSLSKYPDTQLRLRIEFSKANFAGVPSFDELNALEYLDAVVRETLRLHAPVADTVREAMKDTVIPLSEPFTDSKGIMHDKLRVVKGTTFCIPLLSMSRLESIWGLDAHEFRPERWLSSERANLPDGALEMPSVHFPTFFAGSHACIGFRLTLIEMKVLLFHLINAFSFELIDGLDNIQPKSAIVTKPMVRERPNEGYQLPLRVTSVQL